jgi:polysaccharide pyruvyl transferase WcaK-like protein
MVESNLTFGDVSYAHFCHRTYLNQHWQQAKGNGLRGLLRWCDHWLRAQLEPWVYRRVRHIVVPSRGLERELASAYPFTQEKLMCIPNPVDLERMRPSNGFDRAAFRETLGLTADHRMLVFAALGHFERKGLPLLLQAIARLQEPRVRLVVVGGERDLVAAYRAHAQQLQIATQVIFVGKQNDIRPYLWGADGFVLPSHYETFSLVATRVHGVEELLHDGQGGIAIDTTVESITAGLRSFMDLSAAQKDAMIHRARQQAGAYGGEQFVSAWRSFYSRYQLEGRAVAPSPQWLVLGHYGGHNTGDDAMLMGLTLSGGPQWWKQMVVVTKDGALPPYLATTGVRAIRATLGAVLRALPRVQGLVVGGGTHFHDDYVGWRYLRHARYLLLFVGTALLAKVLRKRVLWLSLGFGPFFRTPTKWLTRIGLRLCDQVTVRDAQSYRDVAPWIAPTRLGLTFDLAALLADGAEGKRGNASHPEKSAHMLGISATSVQNSKTGGPVVDAIFWDRFGDSLARLLTQRQDVRVRLFIMRGGTHDDDTALTARVYAKLREINATRVEVIAYEADPTATLHKIGECRAFIATRFHSGILAYLSRCHLLFVTYHRKVRDLANEIGLSPQACIELCDSVTEEELLNRMVALLDGEPAHRPTLPVSEALRRARLNLEILEKYSGGKPVDLRCAEPVAP